MKSVIKVEFPKWPMSNHRELELVNEVVTSGNWWRMTGNKVSTFEQKFAEYHNTKYCLGVSNGTVALELAMATLDIGSGDEVIVPANTFISTITAVIYCNAKPVVVDVDPDNYCIDVNKIREALTPRTKAIIPVHMAGHVCNMDEICKIAKENNLYVIEDASHAHGAEWNGKKVGTFGDVATFSCQNGKLMTSGEGGVILTNNEDIYENAYLIHTGGRPKGDKLYRHILLGSNYRLSEVQAALLIAQLERLPELSIKRDENAKKLDEMMCKIEGIRPQILDPRVTSNPHYMYMFYYDKSKFGNIERNKFVELLNENGVPSYVSYPVVSNTEFFKEQRFRSHLTENLIVRDEDVINAKKIEDEVIWLPHYVLLGGVEHLEFIVDTIKAIKNNADSSF